MSEKPGGNESEKLGFEDACKVQDFLVVHSKKEVREKIIACLKESGGLSEHSKIVEAETFDDAYDIYASSISEKEAALEGHAANTRTDFGMIFWEEHPDVPSFTDMLHNDEKGYTPPFTVIVRDNPELDISWRNTQVDIRKIHFDTPDNLEPKLINSLLRQANMLNYDTTIEVAQEENELYAQLEEEKRRTLKYEDRTIVVPGDVDMNCWYEMLPYLPDARHQESLVDPESKIVLTNKKVASFDVDGTLIKTFVMGRFIRDHLQEKGIYPNIIANLNGAQKKRNTRAFRRMLTILDQWGEKGTYKSPKGNTDKDLLYHDFILEFDDNLALAFKGCDVRQVCEIGHKFAEEDIKRSFPYSKPVIALFNWLGSVTTLWTGAPAEVMPAFMNGWNIKNERCHPTYQVVSGNSDGRLVFDGEIASHGGLTKERTAGLVAAKNLHVFHMGDEKADISAMNVAVQGKKGVHGKGAFVLDISSEKGHGHIVKNIASGAAEFAFRRGHVQLLAKSFTRMNMLNNIRSMLRDQCVWWNLNNGIREDMYDDYTLKLMFLSHRRDFLQYFYKSDFEEEHDVNIDEEYQKFKQAWFAFAQTMIDNGHAQQRLLFPEEKFER